MIVYPLACSAGHAFEGWYASPEAYERQLLADRLECPACGTREVRKLPSAPYVRTSAPAPAAPIVAPAERALALAQLKSLILANTEDVGRHFAQVARRIHQGEETQRGIRGQVSAEEAAELRAEGVPALLVPAEIGLDEIPH